MGQYKENDITNPINVYGVTKYKAEKILLEKSKESLVIRTNVLYDYQSKAKSSFLNWVVDSLKRGEKIKVVDDQFNNPTWTDSISVVIDRAIKAGMTISQIEAQAAREGISFGHKARDYIDARKGTFIGKYGGNEGTMAHAGLQAVSAARQAGLSYDEMQKQAATEGVQWGSGAQSMFDQREFVHLYLYPR